MIPKTSITSLTPQCSKKDAILRNFRGLMKLSCWFLSGAVNGLGDFSEDFANDEDVEARNKMFEEVGMVENAIKINAVIKKIKY